VLLIVATFVVVFLEIHPAGERWRNGLRDESDNHVLQLAVAAGGIPIRAARQDDRLRIEWHSAVGTAPLSP
jgi:hypothetical protein